MAENGGGIRPVYYRKVYTVIVSGILCIAESIIFLLNIEAYRNWLSNFDVWQFWNYFIIGYLGYRVAWWLGWDLLILGIIAALYGLLIRYRDTSEKRDKFYTPIIILNVSALIFPIYTILPGFPANFLIFLAVFLSGVIISGVFNGGSEGYGQEEVGSITGRSVVGRLKVMAERIERLWCGFYKKAGDKRVRRKIIMIYTILPLSVIGYMFLYLSDVTGVVPPSPKPNAPLYTVINGQIYEKTENGYIRLQLMGWDYHYVEFHGPGEAWTEEAKMSYFNKTTIKNDLIKGCEVGNFIRLCAHWFEIEPVKGGGYNWSLLDYCFDVIENYSRSAHKVYVLLEVGPIKTSKIWVQASLPEWMPYRIDLGDPYFLTEAERFVSAVVDRYKNRTSLLAYQIENEPDLMFHTITDPDEKYVITGDLIGYLNRLNTLIKSKDPDHLTSVNIFANDLNAIPTVPDVDILFLDYYGTLKDTPPLTVFTERWANYLGPNRGYGVAELQLNDWQSDKPITPELLEQYYQYCLDSGMTLILWSELHTGSEWEKSALDVYGRPTWKYYKVEEFWNDFKNRTVDTMSIRIRFILLNNLIILGTIISGCVLSAVLYTVMLLVPLVTRVFPERKKRLHIISENLRFYLPMIFTLIVYNGTAWIFVTVANAMLFLMGMAVLFAVITPIISEVSYFRILYSLAKSEGMTDIRKPPYFTPAVILISLLPAFLVGFIGFRRFY